MQPERDEDTEARLDRQFSALADGTRREIVARLADGPMSVGELAEPFPISLPAISRHVKVLERAGILAREVDGRVHRLSVDPEGLDEVQAWLDHYRQFWTESLDNLAEYVERGQDPEEM